MHIMIHKMHLDYLVSHELILFFSLQENSLTSEGWVTRLSAYLLPMISTKHLGRVLLNFSYILCSKPLAHPFSTLPMCLMNLVNDKLVGCCAWKLACMATQMTIFNLYHLWNASDLDAFIKSGHRCQIALPFSFTEIAFLHWNGNRPI